MPVVDSGALRRGCRNTARSSWSCWVSSGLSVKSSAATYGERTSWYSQTTNPLRHLHSAKLGATEQRWVAELTAYNFSVKYRPAKENRNADALSRHPVRMPVPETLRRSGLLLPVANRPPKSLGYLLLTAIPLPTSTFFQTRMLTFGDCKMKTRTSLLSVV